MTTAAVYARFSSERQREESIADQLRVCRDFAAREGYDVVAAYTDEARSGTDAERRPGFQRMVRDAERAGWGAVIVYKMDRFARNRYDSAMYKARLKRCGTRLVSATEGIPDGPEGIILDAVLEGMAEYYSANLAQNVRRGMEGNALKCRHNGVTVYGYRCEPDGTYSIDKLESAAVRHAFEMAAAGERKSAIAAWMNGAGYRTAKGREWDVNKVSKLLAMRRYMGEYSWGGVVVPGGMPAIVSRELWEAANRSVPRGRPCRRDETVEYLLSGIFYTADGDRMEPTSGTSHTGDVHRYYRCRRTGQSIRKGDAERRVREAVAGLLADGSMDDEIVEAVMAYHGELTAADRAAAEALRSRIAGADGRVSNLLDAIERGGASARLSERIRAVEAERAACEAELAELERGMPAIEPDMVRFFLHKLRGCDAPDAVVRGFVSRVVIDRDGSMRVEFELEGSGLPRGSSETPQNSTEPAGNPTGSDSCAVVGFGGTSPNPRIYAIPGGFAVAA